MRGRTRRNSEFLIHNSYTFWISRLANLLQEDFNKRLKNEDISWPQWMVLNVLGHQVARTPAAVADEIGVDRSAVTRLLDRLENKGLVERQHDKQDRRSVTVGLTEAGMDGLVRLNQLAQQHQNHFLNSLHATEHRSLKGNLQKMLRRGGIDSLGVWKQT